MKVNSISSISSINYQPKRNARVQKQQQQNVNFKGDGKAALYGLGAAIVMVGVSTLIPPLAPATIPAIVIAAKEGSKK